MNDIIDTASVNIEEYILTVRGQQVMLDRDLAMLYRVETRRLNESVKRNIERFPTDFMFQLSLEEFSLMSQIATSNRGGTRKLPYAFTENGIAMLSGLLNTPIAIEMNIRIMRAFVSMRRFLSSNMQMFQRVEILEHRQLSLEEQVGTHGNQIEEVFKRLEKKQAVPTQGVFYNGEIFNAYQFVCDLVRTATKSIVLIDNYIDDTVLVLLDKRGAGVEATVYTEKISDTLRQDIAKHNAQYPPIEVQTIKTVHDRFLMVDEAVYHIGASIKDLGKKVFAFSLLQDFAASAFLRQLV